MEKTIKEMKSINHIFHDRKENIIQGLFLYTKRGNERIANLSSTAIILVRFINLNLSFDIEYGCGIKSAFLL